MSRATAVLVIGAIALAAAAAHSESHLQENVWTSKHQLVHSFTEEIPEQSLISTTNPWANGHFHRHAMAKEKAAVGEREQIAADFERGKKNCLYTKKYKLPHCFFRKLKAPAADLEQAGYGTIKFHPPTFHVPRVHDEFKCHENSYCKGGAMLVQVGEKTKGKRWYRSFRRSSRRRGGWSIWKARRRRTKYTGPAHRRRRSNGVPWSNKKRRMEMANRSIQHMKHNIRSLKHHMDAKIKVVLKNAEDVADRVFEGTNEVIQYSKAADDFRKEMLELTKELCRGGKDERDAVCTGNESKSSASAAEDESQAVRVVEGKVGKLYTKAEKFVRKLAKTLRLGTCLIRQEAEKKCIPPLEHARDKKLRELKNTIARLHREAVEEAARAYKRL